MLFLQSSIKKHNTAATLKIPLMILIPTDALRWHTWGHITFLHVKIAVAQTITFDTFDTPYIKK